MTQDTFLRPRSILGSDEEATICPFAFVFLHITPTVVILSLVRNMITLAALYGTLVTRALSTLDRGATGQLKQLLILQWTVVRVTVLPFPTNPILLVTFHTQPLTDNR